MSVTIVKCCTVHNCNLYYTSDLVPGRRYHCGWPKDRAQQYADAINAADIARTFPYADHLEFCLECLRNPENRLCDTGQKLYDKLREEREKGSDG